jgi:hypothetical protein
LSIFYQEEEAEARRNKPAWHSPPLVLDEPDDGLLAGRAALQSSSKIGGTALVLSEPDTGTPLRGQREARKGRRYSGIGGCWWKRGKKAVEAVCASIGSWARWSVVYW